MNLKKLVIRQNWYKEIETIFQNKIDFINFLKIFLIFFTFFSLVGNFIPFYDTDDASIFAFTSINLSDGKYSVSNELLEETGSWNFVPRHWIKTIDNNVIPNIDLGFPFIGAIAYSIAGNYGLFYIVPIISTIFLILVDRISTNLFGRNVGLLVLLFITSSFWILRFGSQSMSDLPFVLVFIIGCFYFLKYLNKSLEKYLFLASCIFVVSTFIRMIGVVFLFVEIFIILSFFIYNKYFVNIQSENPKNSNHNSVITSISITRSLKIVFSIAGPWLVFFLFLLSYNDQYFGNPLSLKDFVNETLDYKLLEQIENESEELGFSLKSDLTISEIISEARSKGLIVSKKHSILSFNPENIMGYFRAVLPFPLSHDIEFIDKFDNLFGKYWIGLVTPILLVSIFWIAYKKNLKRKEITVLSFFLLSIILLYSLLPTAEVHLEKNTSQRYSIPAFTIFSIMLGFLITEVFKINFKNIPNRQMFKKIFKILILIFLFVFFLTAFYFTPTIQAIMDGEFVFKNPNIYADKFPFDKEGLTSQSIILDSKGHLTQERGAIPLRSLGANFNPELFDNNPSSLELILQIKELMNKGYDVYVYKEPSRDIDKLYFRFIINNTDLVLKTHSNSFCKFYFSENSNTKPDGVCL